MGFYEGNSGRISKKFSEEHFQINVVRFKKKQLKYFWRIFGGIVGVVGQDEKAVYKILSRLGKVILQENQFHIRKAVRS